LLLPRFTGHPLASSNDVGRQKKEWSKRESGSRRSAGDAERRVRVEKPVDDDDRTPADELKAGNGDKNDRACRQGRFLQAAGETRRASDKLFFGVAIMEE
jgi:hypothetical protein